ncbi:MAG: hypothetical protein AABY22_06090 [Nanoarchaeota archaeon]
MSHLPSSIKKISLFNVTSNTTIVIPKGHVIIDIIIENTTANIVTGGIKIGTTSGGIDVIVALPVGANSLSTVLSADILKRVFSKSSDQTLYVETVTLWNSSNLNIDFLVSKII